MFKKSLLNKSVLLGLALSACSLPVVAQQSVYLLDRALGNDDSSLIVLDIQTGALSLEVPLPNISAREMYQSLDGQSIYVQGFQEIHTVNLNDGTVTEYAVPDVTFSDAEKSLTSDDLYVVESNSSSGVIKAVDLADGSTRSTFVVPGLSSRNVELHPANGHVYVQFETTSYTNAQPSQVMVFDPQTLLPSSAILIPDGFSNINSDMVMSNSGDELYIFSPTQLLTINTADDSVVMTNIDRAGIEPGSADQVIISKDDSTLYVVRASWDLDVIDIATSSLTTSIKLPRINNGEVAPPDPIVDFGTWYYDFALDSSGGSLFAYGTNLHWDPNTSESTQVQRLARIDLASNTVEVPLIDVPLGNLERLVPVKILFSDNSSDPSLQAQDVAASFVRCQNYTTGQVVDFVPQLGETTWSCKDHGLLFNTGDDVMMAVRGNVQ